MVEVIAHVAAGIGLLVGGILIGAHGTNLAPTLTKAIDLIDTAEKEAQSVLATITAHKAK